MKYRRFGKLDFEVSALGFGCMRLPTTGSYSDIDEKPAIEMIRYAIDQGVNYLDTAHVYHGGNSERVIAKALEGGYREKARVADKLPVWEAQKPDDFDRLLDMELERLGTSKIDFYLLHNLQAPSWARVRDLGVLDWVEKIRADGRIDRIGFSYHDNFDTLVEIIEAYDGWSFCQLQYNYVNENVQAGTKGVEYAGGKGLAVVIMEPLLGGCLAGPPEDVRVLMDEAPKKRTPVDWALQWIWNRPEVSVVLSGMGTMEQVRQNIESACNSGAGTLTDDELAVIARVREKYEAANPVGCTRCAYCMPCPNGVNIPLNMQLYDDMLVFKGNQEGLNRNLYNDMPEGARASSCTECAECEEKCPQDIKISEWMPKIHEKLKRQS
ncbi:MAG: aldo/keto reductase [Planctomycetota bacterium]|jgi:predicted aldo/keto reductase-like oxidoreductase